MKLLPWTIRRADEVAELERRADSSYTDALVASLVSQAQAGKPANYYATAALEACAGLVGRAFAAAEVNARPAIRDALTPAFMELLGRALIRRGELVAAIDVDEMGLTLCPASSHDVAGGFMPDGWRYRLNMAGPSRTTTRRRVRAAGVVHVMYSRDPERPWRGNGPLQVAQLAGKLSAETVRALGDAASGPTGTLLSTPVDGKDPTITELKRDLKTLSGKVALVKGGDWGNAGGIGQGETWRSQRIGADPPEPLILQAKHASAEVFAACGINPAIFEDHANGTAAREGWRQMLFGLLSPLGNLVAAELADKLESPVSLEWDELRAADISGRARAFQSMVGGGMEIDRAAALSGLLSPDED